MRMIWMVSVAIVLMSSLTLEQEASPLHLMPWPAKVKTFPASQHLLIDTSFAVGLDNHADARLRTTVALFRTDSHRHSGVLPLDRIITSPGKAQVAIRSGLASTPVPELG